MGLKGIGIRDCGEGERGRYINAEQTARGEEKVV